MNRNIVMGILLGCATLCPKNTHAGGPAVESGAGNTLGSAADNPAETEIRNRLLALARMWGTVRVIVGVKVEFVPEGELDESAVQSQRSAIAAAQSAVLAAVSPRAPDRVRRFESIPFLAMEVNEEELERLMRLPEVASIEEDRLAEPHTHESLDAPQGQ